jgi:CRISPR system Cascade subunit CasA
VNLLHDPWMPVRDAEGARHWITAEQLADPRWRAFDADRPDFNGALAQFAIGLLQTTAPVPDEIAWTRLLRTPPEATMLRAWFEPVAAVFELDGDGPRFMQDPDLGSNGVAVNEVGALLIESPGDQTVVTNRDHFVKRGQVRALCPACAALALFTLQTNAPSGGAGHRTGLRGGGPLTTLVVSGSRGPLWSDLWLNVLDRPRLARLCGDLDRTEPHQTFPWMAALSALQAPTPKGELPPAQVHPAHMFWAMPRRIRLQFEPATPIVTCDLCGNSTATRVERYATKNYGLNYKGAWVHALSPYKRKEAEEVWLPLHPQPDGLGWQHWLAWVLGAAGERQTTRIAAVVERALAQPASSAASPRRLWAFGYDMDNMKARCWYESVLPIYALGEADDRHARRAVQSEVARWVEAASLAAMYLRGSVKDAWFGADARGDFGHVDAQFWSATEAGFYRLLHALIAEVGSTEKHDPLPARQDWHITLIRTAERLFDASFVGTGCIERENPRRAALAFQHLRRNLRGPKLRAALGLPVEAATEKSARKTSRRTSRETA